MQYCPKCRIQIRGNKRCCPLCQGQLTQTAEDPAFPALKKSPVTSFSIMRFATFIFLTLEIVMAATGYLAEHQAGLSLSWVPLVMIGAVVAWVDLILAMYLRNNVMKIITVEAYIAMVIDYIIDRMTGFYGWSVIWMIPATFAGLVVVTVMIGKLARLRLEDYVIYLLADGVLCLTQIIPIIHGHNSFEWPAVICMAGYLIGAVAMVVFRYHDLKSASAKFFNV